MGNSISYVKKISLQNYSAITSGSYTVSIGDSSYSITIDGTRNRNTNVAKNKDALDTSDQITSIELFEGLIPLMRLKLIRMMFDLTITPIHINQLYGQVAITMPMK